MGSAIEIEEKKHQEQRKTNTKEKELQSVQTVGEQLESGQVLTWRMVGSWTN
jgi:hypothetical protein